MFYFLSAANLFRLAEKMFGGIFRASLIVLIHFFVKFFFQHMSDLGLCEDLELLQSQAQRHRAGIMAQCLFAEALSASITDALKKKY